MVRTQPLEGARARLELQNKAVWQSFIAGALKLALLQAES